NHHGANAMTPDMRATMRDVYQRVAWKHGLDEAEMYIRDQSKFATSARYEAWADLRQKGFSYPEIAALAGWDHTTIMNGVRRYIQSIERGGREHLRLVDEVRRAAQ